MKKIFYLNSAEQVKRRNSLKKMIAFEEYLKSKEEFWSEMLTFMRYALPQKGGAAGF